MGDRATQITAHVRRERYAASMQIRQSGCALVLCAFVGCGGKAPQSEAGPGDLDTTGAQDASSAKDASGPNFVPVVIDFDELKSGQVITNQYSDHVVFSSDAGISIAAWDTIPIGQSPPNFMSAGSSNNVLHPLYIDFSKPVRGLTFNTLGVTSTGVVAHIKVHVNGQLADTVNLVGKGNSFVPVPVDLSAYASVTRIEVVDITDLDGICYDDFSFEFPR